MREAGEWEAVTLRILSLTLTLPSGGASPLPIKKTVGTPSGSASHFFRVYFKLEGVTETEIGLNEVV